MSTAPGRPLRIVLEGNCQANAVGFAIRSAIHLSGADAFMLRVNTNRPVPAGLSEFAPDEQDYLRQSDVFVRQVWQHAAPSIRNLLPPGIREIRFPAFRMNFLWPFATQPHPRNRMIQPWLEYGAYPTEFGNSLINALLRDESDEHAVFDRFMAIDQSRKTDFDRLFELSREKARALDADADIPVWPFLEANFQRRHLFRDSGHFTWLGVEPVCRAIIEALPLGLGTRELDRIFRVLAYERTGAAREMPIHPQVSRHFNLDWCDPAKRYRHEIHGWYDHDQYIRRYIDFATDEDLHFGFYYTFRSSDRLGDAEAALRRGLDRDPDNAETRLSLATNLVKQERHDEAVPWFEAALLDPDLAQDARHHEAYAAALLTRPDRAADALGAIDRAATLSPDYARLHRTRGRILFDCRDFAAAVGACRAALALEPASAEDENRLGLSLIAVGRTGDGLQALDRAVALDRREPRYAIDLAKALADAGQMAMARGVIEWIKQTMASGAETARVEAALGDGG
jgi:tetratricopeptide (TPR) repeat protein